jgi:hypothetical protein
VLTRLQVCLRRVAECLGFKEARENAKGREHGLWHTFFCTTFCARKRRASAILWERRQQSRALCFPILAARRAQPSTGRGWAREQEAAQRLSFAVGPLRVHASRLGAGVDTPILAGEPFAHTWLRRSVLATCAQSRQGKGRKNALHSAATENNRVDTTLHL